MNQSDANEDFFRRSRREWDELGGHPALKRRAGAPVKQHPTCSDPMLVRELWLADRLRVTAEVFQGVTDRTERARRLRTIIRAMGMADQPCGRRQGERVTFAQCFQAIYGETC